MKFFKCMPAEHHATVAVNHSKGKPYAVYDGLIGRCYRHMDLGYEKNGWFAGWRYDHAILSNCRDTTWIVTSPYMSHVWHVDKAGTTIIVGSGAQVHLIFADGVVVDFDKPDFDRPHNWGNMEVYYNPSGYLLHFIWDNPNGRLLVFNINELHLLATVMATSDQYAYDKRLKRETNTCGGHPLLAGCKGEPTWACMVNP